MKRLFRKSFWKTLFLSYLVILIFSIATGAALLATSLSKIEESAGELSRVALRQISDSLDRAEADLHNLMIELRTRQEYTSLVYMDGELTGIKREKISQLQSEMVRQSAYNHYVSGIYVWFEKPQLAATTNGLIKTAEGFDSLLKRELGVGWTEVLQWISDSDNTLSVQLLGEGRFTQNMAAVIRDTSYGSEHAPVLVLKLRPGAFQQILSTTEEESAENKTVFWGMSNDDGRLIAPAESQTLAASVNTASLQEGKTVRLSHEGEEMVVQSMEAGKSFAVVSAVSLTSYTETLRHYQTIAVVYLGCYLAAGTLIALFLSRRNSQPIERLNRIILDKAADSSGDSEFAMLEAGINSLLRYSRDYERSKVKEEKFLREQFLLSLLTGTAEEPDFSEACTAHAVTFASERFAVVAVMLRDYGRLFLDNKSGQKKETQEIALFAAESVAGELLDECGSAYLCRQDGKIWAIVSPYQQLGRDDREFLSVVRDICGRAEMFLREQLGMEVGFYISGLSRPCKGGDGIAAAYREALWGKEQLEAYAIRETVNDRGSVERQIKPEHEQPRENLGEKRRQFYSAVTAGDFEEADRLYLELRRQDIASVDESFSAVKMQTVALIGYFLSNLPPEALESHSGEINRHIGAIREEQRDDRLIAAMHEWMVYFRGLHAKTAAQAETETGDVAAQAGHFINAHYTDSDLSVLQVAEALSVSASYLSRAFRKKYSTSVLDYIHRRRIDTAKLLLRESSGTVKSIGEQVGYANTLAFLRAFKREEGNTPTEYRKSLSPGQSAVVEPPEELIP